MLFHVNTSASHRLDRILRVFRRHHGENGRKGETHAGLLQHPERDRHEARRRHHVVGVVPPAHPTPPAVPEVTGVCVSPPAGTPPSGSPASSVGRSSPSPTWRWWPGSWACTWSLSSWGSSSTAASSCRSYTSWSWGKTPSSSSWGFSKLGSRPSERRPGTGGFGRRVQFHRL